MKKQREREREREREGHGPVQNATNVIYIGNSRRGAVMVNAHSRQMVRDFILKSRRKKRKKKQSHARAGEFMARHL